MSDREILQQAAAVFREQYPALTAEAVIIFIVIADHEAPTIENVSASMSQTEAHVFHHTAPLRDAGLVVLQPDQNGSRKILLTGRGEEAKIAITEVIAG